MAIWQGKGGKKKLQVKVKGIKLLGLKIEEKERVMGVQMKWQGHSRSGISSLYRKTHQAQNKEIKPLKFGQGINDYDYRDNDDDDDSNGFVKVCSFLTVSKDPISFAPWLVSFIILCGESESSPSSSTSSTFSREKMQVIGRAELNLGELASKMESQIEQRVPVTLQLDGVAKKATFRVIVSFFEMKNNSHSHSRTMSQDMSGMEMNPGDSTTLLRRAMSQRPLDDKEKAKKNKFRLFGKLSSSKKLDENPTTSNSGREYVVVASDTKNGEPNSVTELGTLPSSEAQLDLVKKGGFWKWKRRRSKKKIAFSGSTTVMEQAENKSNVWEARELTSRDGKTKLKANVFLASYDQRDEKVAGESACAVIVAVIAHWLLLNPRAMPTGPELDLLITEGSTEWRKLCKDESHQEFFPDQHFDLETILQADLRPLTVHPSNSRFGFFHPEDFDHLKHAPSFDEIWDEINKSVDHFEPRVYIVRWNDHFFVLKVETDANYIIDSLGERLHEGCNQAYILKFDDSTVMSTKDDEGEEEKVICRGKECCKEYMKRFLAAIPLRELKEAKEKGKTVDVFALYQRLQIDFHLSTPSSSCSTSVVSTANTSVSASPDTSPVLTASEEHVQL